MTICVYGLWHLGCVTAACVAERFATIGLDPDPANVARLQGGQPPILEPGLAELVQAGTAEGRLRFTSDTAAAIGEAAIVWVTFDTPVNEQDEADCEYVERMVAAIFPHLRSGAVVLISSQLPVGTTARLEARYREEFPAGDAAFAIRPRTCAWAKRWTCSAIPDASWRACRTPALAPGWSRLLAAFCDNVIWMSVASAEMTKHAVNAFLANSVMFINEVATLCEETGADAKEVERGLKSEERIGPRAYLGAGGAFSGGTLARDVAFLTARARQAHLETPLLASIRESNERHKHWPRRKLAAMLGSLAGKTVRGARAYLQARHGHAAALRRDRTVHVAGGAEGDGARFRPRGEAVARGTGRADHAVRFRRRSA